jgi:5-methyltetrahydrofolate--homocysteine methyltransferase
MECGLGIVCGELRRADGAWGTEFQKLGAALGACLDEWNLTKPELVRRVAENYVQAGSRVILTNTFRANCISLAPYGLQGKVEAINRAAVKISRQAAGDSAMVFASIGPSGKMLLTKEVNADQLREDRPCGSTHCGRGGAGDRTAGDGFAGV